MVLAFRTDLRLDALLWGCVLAFSLHNARERDKLRHQLGIPMAIVLAVVAAVCGAIENTIGQAFTALLLPVVISATVLHPQWAFSRLLETAPLRWIGRLSYSLYLWQQVMFIATSLTPIHTGVSLPLLLAITTVLAVCCHYGIERPVLAWSHRWRRRNTSTTRSPISLAAATKTASAG